MTNVDRAVRVGKRASQKNSSILSFLSVLHSLFEYHSGLAGVQGKRHADFMTLKVLTTAEILENLQVQKNPAHQGYFAFYSSWYGGITRDPRWMMVPADDHQVHRGDGVFEAMKALDRKVFLLDSHLDRMEKSAARIGLKLPFPKTEVKEIVLKTLQVSDQFEAVIRLFVSRGPGSYSPNPYDSVGSQLYIAVTELKAPTVSKFEHGVRIGFSSVPVKDSWMAQVKSCNYLPNVMMKKESVDRNLEFCIGVDSKGFVAEGPTENLVIVDQNEVLVHPVLENILFGTTMKKVFQLAEANGIKTAVRSIAKEEVGQAREVMMMGTTIDVLPVVEVEGRPVQDGKPGAIAKKLLSLLQQEMKTGQDLTPY